MRLPSNSSTLVPAILAQVLIASFFFLVVLLQDSTLSQLSSLDIDSTVIKGVPGAFSRYIYWLIAALIISLSFTVVDSRKSELPKNRAILLYSLSAFFLFYLVLTRTLQFTWNQDDAYIDFRYVMNWLDGISLDYNDGERVMGFTSHLHLVVLSMGYWLLKGLGLPVISQTINTGFQIASFYLIHYLLKISTKNHYSGFIASSLFALSTYNIQESYGGKETAIVVALMLFSLIGIELKKLHIVSWSSALILLTRPEGGLWMLISLFWSYKNFQWQAIKAWLGPGILLTGVAGWLYSNFGTIVPHGLIGKSTMFYSPPFMGDLVLVLRRIADGCFVPELLFPIDPILSYAGDFCRLYAGVLVLLAILKLLNVGSLRFYSIAVLSYWILFSIKNPYLFPWYYAWFGLVAPILLTIIFLKLFEIQNENSKSKNAIFAIVLITYLAAVQIVQQPNRNLSKGLTAITFFWSSAHKRLVIYKKAAEEANLLSSDKKDYLAAPEIGVLGAYYKGPILDLGGLVSDNVLKFGPPKDEIRQGYSLFSIIPETLQELKPRFLVTDGAFCKKGIWKDNWFEDNYEVRKFYPHRLWSDGIYLYELNPAKSDNPENDNKTGNFNTSNEQERKSLH